MIKKKSILFGIAALLLAILVGGHMIRAAKNDLTRDAYTSVVTVSGFVLEQQPFTRYVEETGTLEGNKESLIAAETGGRVLEVYVEVGDYVHEGQPLIRLDDELYQLESERAKIAFDKATMDLDRVQKLYDQKSISESDFENARLGAKGAEVQYRMANKTYNDATIKAPFSGTVAARMTQVGQMIERGMPVVQLVDIASLKLTVPVSETDLKYLSVGAPATIIVDAASDTVQGKVSAVGSRATTGTRTFPVEIKLAGDKKLRSGMFARAVITANTIPDGLLLPRAATLPDMGRTVVFLARGRIAQKVPVRVIGSNGDHVAVEGIARGDTVIVTGNQMLSQGSTINLTLTSGERHDTN
jgi:membrane fusion protein (multidrug efflux system)